MTKSRKNDSVVNIDAWSLDDEERSIIGQSEDDPAVEAPGELELRRTGACGAAEQRELLRHEFPDE